MSEYQIPGFPADKSIVYSMLFCTVEGKPELYIGYQEDLKKGLSVYDEKSKSLRNLHTDYKMKDLCTRVHFFHAVGDLLVVFCLNSAVKIFKKGELVHTGTIEFNTLTLGTTGALYLEPCIYFISEREAITSIDLSKEDFPTTVAKPTKYRTLAICARYGKLAALFKDNIIEYDGAKGELTPPQKDDFLWVSLASEGKYLLASGILKAEEPGHSGVITTSHFYLVSSQLTVLDTLVITVTKFEDDFAGHVRGVELKETVLFVCFREKAHVDLLAVDRKQKLTQVINKMKIAEHDIYAVTGRRPGTNKIQWIIGGRQSDGLKLIALKFL